MSTTCTPERCDTCPGKIVCRCLNVTEEQVVNLITSCGLRSIHEIRQYTSAGDGCTCCHAELAQYLERYSLAVVA